MLRRYRKENETVKLVKGDRGERGKPGIEPEEVAEIRARLESLEGRIKKLESPAKKIKEGKPHDKATGRKHN